jgi:hypothetical protein
VVEDETSIWNTGAETAREFMSIKMRPNEISSWIAYPEQYKFFSAQFELSQEIAHIDRQTYDLFDMASDIGGVLEILQIIFGTFTMYFSGLRLKAFLTNRLFVLGQSERNANMRNSMLIPTKDLKKNNLLKNTDGTIRVDVPFFLDLQDLVFFLLPPCCCRKQKMRFAEYSKVVGRGYDDVVADLDIVRIVRRLRMHGVGLIYLLNKT